ncbi:uncharacterized protein ACA1_175660 [Acanthamoeba castellanii str. Neff]|uniref:F-box domain-containing protein n=1 Tax=Acanthamoeba castellanii (strain ATCC 30010 / Neff) TaxID=1257118 RepID=L8HKF7_ACACF|nr:uncharacterized protein ACA1_175660 [Acanthamoeba castellanii str. Neff]ELR24891.1 hypothetical protein ACA1_175660 [Acanthamoeba castellanii str. Neff]
MKRASPSSGGNQRKKDSPQQEKGGKRKRPIKRPRASAAPAPLRFPSIAGVTFDKTQRRWGPAKSNHDLLELPPEVWSLVFARLRHDPAALVRASHVSRAWRSLALGELRRWTFAADGEGRPAGLESQLQFLRELCPRVEAIHVRHDGFDMADLHHLLNGLPRVHTLHLVVSPLTLAKLINDDSDDGSDDDGEGDDDETEETMVPGSIRSLELTFVNLLPTSRLERLWRRLPRRLDALRLNGLRSPPDRLFGRLRELTKLHMKSCFAVDDAVMPRLPRSLTNLSVQGARVTDRGVTALTTTLPNLKKLDLSRCVNVTQESIGQLPQGLETLKLAFCQHIRDDALRKLPPGLRKLNCWGCGNITNAGVRALPAGLEELTLSFCKVDDEGIAQLPRGLKRIVIQYCFRVTLKGLEENLPARVRSVHMGSRDSTGDLSAYPRLSRLLTDHPLPFLS